MCMGKDKVCQCLIERNVDGAIIHGKGVNVL